MRAPTTTVVRLAPEWDEPAALTFCGELEAISRRVPPDAVIHRARNLIFRQGVGGQEVAVKRFPVTGGRRLLYRWRTSKALRSFDNASRLVFLGIGTPRPLAAVEVRRGPVLLASFYCCAFLPVFQEARALKRREAPDGAALTNLLGEFIGRIHEKGVLHRDLTSGNVLMVPDAGGRFQIAFQLVDTNRIRFGRVGVQAGLATLAQLRLHDEGMLLSGYCRARGLASGRVGPYYRVRLGLRSAARALKDRSRPLRRRFGL